MMKITQEQQLKKLLEYNKLLFDASNFELLTKFEEILGIITENSLYWEYYQASIAQYHQNFEQLEKYVNWIADNNNDVMIDGSRLTPGDVWEAFVL
ncbi:MAG: hypothetical protein V7L22_30860 [Nostoc sp.]|uniref:hypothetical protein n=1 Tax=Nostoc sp. TaxID=1180 RepID=UPI002FFC9286